MSVLNYDSMIGTVYFDRILTKNEIKTLEHHLRTAMQTINYYRIQNKKGKIEYRAKIEG